MVPRLSCDNLFFSSNLFTAFSLDVLLFSIRFSMNMCLALGCQLKYPQAGCSLQLVYQQLLRFPITNNFITVILSTLHTLQQATLQSISMNFHQVPSAAQKLYTTTNPQEKEMLENTLIALIGNYRHIDGVRQILGATPYSMLAISSILIQTIRNDAYIPQGIYSPHKTKQQMGIENLSEEPRVEWQDIYMKLILSAHQHLFSLTLQKHLENSLIQLSALCVKRMIAKKMRYNYMQTLLGILFPAVQPTPKFRDTLQVPPPVQLYEKMPKYLLGVRILIQLFEDVNESDNFPTYAAFRDCDQLLKQRFLSEFLYYSIFLIRYPMLKVFTNPQLAPNLLPDTFFCIKLLSLILSFPLEFYKTNQQDFDMTWDCEIDNCKNYPVEFLSLTRDLELMKCIAQIGCIYHVHLSTETRSINIDSLTILSLLCNSTLHNYTSSKQQRLTFRGFCVSTSIHLVQSLSYFDEAYLNILLDIFWKILKNYGAEDYCGKEQEFCNNALLLCYTIVDKCQIVYAEEDTNVIYKAFRLVKATDENLLSTIEIRQLQLNDDFLRVIGQQRKGAHTQILKRFLARICNLKQSGRIFTQHTFLNYKKELKFFQQLFQHVVYCFDINFTSNVTELCQLNFQLMDPYSRVMMVFFATAVLSQHRSPYQIQIPQQLVLKMLTIVKGFNQLCDLRFESWLMIGFLNELVDQIPQSGLWNRISSQLQSNFQEQFQMFITNIIKTFTSTNNQKCIDYAVNILTEVFSCIEKSCPEYTTNGQFAAYSNMMTEFFLRLDNTVFSNPHFFKKRVSLYSLLATVSLRDGDITKCYAIYNNIRGRVFNAPKLQFLFAYLYDVTGLLKKVGDKSRQTLIQLIITDLSLIDSTFLGQPQFLSNQQLRKALIKLSYAILFNQDTRTPGFQIHGQCSISCQMRVIWQIVRKCATRPFKKSLINTWKLLIQSNPIELLPPLPDPNLLIKHPQMFQVLVDHYCQNIYRVSDMMDLYSKMGENLNYHFAWWERVIQGNMGTVPFLFSQFISNRKWRNGREQQQTAAQILYMVSLHNPKERCIPGLFEEPLSQQQFIAKFIALTSL